MKRDRGYFRKMRKKHIKRKKNIIKNVYLAEGYYDHDGQYSKGKIHCSCPMCASKTNTKHLGRTGKHYCLKPMNWKHSDLLKIQDMQSELKEYEQVI